MISFTSIGINQKLTSKRQLKAWINDIVVQEGKKAGAVSYVFCTDEVLLKYNIEYLDHKDYTDIITFDYSEGETVSGDIMISIERVKENAVKFKVSIAEEMSRVMAHGILHLCGYKDKNPDEKKLMREMENKHMQHFPKTDKPFIC